MGNKKTLVVGRQFEHIGEVRNFYEEVALFNQIVVHFLKKRQRISTGQPFGFMSLLGFLSLMGMLIKNAVVLVDQIDINIREGIAPLNAIIEAGVSRANPVAMAAATTILGMTPLLFDAFFIAMAVTIMTGLAFATVLTLVFVPVLYAMFFRIDTRNAA